MIFTEQTENGNIVFNEFNTLNERQEYSVNWNDKSQALNFSGNTGGSYMHDALYESYIQAKIDSEDRLAFALKESMVISEADYSNIKAIHEAKLGDKIKSRWKKFVAFIKRMFAKFMESISSILLNEKDYLEKYKDIILKKKGKEEIEYSYTGDYEEGIKRLINTEVKLFDYNTYKNELEAEGEGPLVNKIMEGKMHYTDGDTLSEQFKNFFLNLDAGQKEGNLADGKIKMIDLYNFCYNFEKIKKIVDTDNNRLEASTRAIENMINQQIKDNQTVQQAAAIVGYGKAFTENKEQQGQDQTQDQQTGSNGNNDNNANKNSMGLKIGTTAATTKMNSTNDRDNDAEKKMADDTAKEAIKNGNKEDAISKAADRWISVNQALISAKLTACQQISNDYMEIIRAHVRSYGGTDKKSKEGNTSPGPAKEYLKDAEKLENEAKRQKNQINQQDGGDTK